MKKLIIILLSLYIVISCGMQGPNYNDDKYHRQRTVLREDRRMRKAMIRARRRGARAVRLSSGGKVKMIRKVV